MADAPQTAFAQEPAVQQRVGDTSLASAVSSSAAPGSGGSTDTLRQMMTARRLLSLGTFNSVNAFYGSGHLDSFSGASSGRDSRRDSLGSHHTHGSTEQTTAPVEPPCEASALLLQQAAEPFKLPAQPRSRHVSFAQPAPARLYDPHRLADVPSYGSNLDGAADGDGRAVDGDDGGGGDGDDGSLPLLNGHSHTGMSADATHGGGANGRANGTAETFTIHAMYSAAGDAHGGSATARWAQADSGSVALLKGAVAASDSMAGERLGTAGAGDVKAGSGSDDSDELPGAHYENTAQEWQHLRRVIASSVIGNTLEWYDFLVYVYLGPTITKLFFPPGNVYAHMLAFYGIFAAGFLTRPLGALVFGHIGDRYGRKTALMLSIYIMSIPTALVGCLPTYKQAGLVAPVLLVIIRVAQGFAVGGEFTSTMVFLVEHAPPHHRGLQGSLAFASVMIGVITGSLIATFFNAHTGMGDDRGHHGQRLPAQD